MAKKTYTAATTSTGLMLKAGGTVVGGSITRDTFVISGSNGNDTITGGNNADQLSGGAGNDILNGGTGNDTLDGGTGIDVVDYSAATAAFTFNMTANVGWATSTGASFVAPSSLGTDFLKNIEGVIGGSGNDNFIGDVNANILNGGAGNDTVSGGAGSDTLDGGVGNDTVSYVDKNTGVIVSLASTFAQDLDGAGSGIESDTLSNFENIIGGNGADTLTGDSNVNVLDGSAGNDTLNGGAGNDTLDGGAGIDVVDYSAATTAFNFYMTSNVDWATSTGASFVAPDSLGTDVLKNIEGVIGGSGNDNFVGDSNPNILNGGAGNDKLSGGAGNDTLEGGTGIDTVYFNNNTGVIVSLAITSAQDLDGAGLGTESDTLSNFENISGGSGADILTGDSNANVLDGYTGNDTLMGGAGNDTLNGSSGNDSLIGGDGLDIVVYDMETNSITFTAGSTTSLVLSIAYGTDTLDLDIEGIIGGYGSDNLTGDARNNYLSGGRMGTDVLIGGAGNDTLYGGTGVDSLTGGTGVDTFISATSFANPYFDLNSTAVAVTNVITDFYSADGDKISGSALAAGNAANYLEAGASATDLASLLSAADSALNGIVKYYVGQVGNDAYLVADNDGMGHTDVIQLIGVSLATIDASSIIA